MDRRYPDATSDRQIADIPVYDNRHEKSCHNRLFAFLLCFLLVFFHDPCSFDSFSTTVCIQVSLEQLLCPTPNDGTNADLQPTWSAAIASRLIPELAEYFSSYNCWNTLTGQTNLGTELQHLQELIRTNVPRALKFSPTTSPQLRHGTDLFCAAMNDARDYTYVTYNIHLVGPSLCLLDRLARRHGSDVLPAPEPSSLNVSADTNSVPITDAAIAFFRLCPHH